MRGCRNQKQWIHHGLKPPFSFSVTCHRHPVYKTMIEPMKYPPFHRNYDIIFQTTTVSYYNCNSADVLTLRLFYVVNKPMSFTLRTLGQNIVNDRTLLGNYLLVFVLYSVLATLLVFPYAEILSSVEGTVDNNMLLRTILS